MPTSEGESLLWFSILAVSEVFPPEQIAAWQELIRMPPEALGVERSRWTLATLRGSTPAWYHYSLAGLWRLLRVLKIHYKRGRQYVHSPDPDYIGKRDAAQACVDAARWDPDQVATCRPS